MGNKVVLPKICIEEIDKMIKEGRIIFFVGEKVIDATNFINEHPGGVKSIKSKIGKDCKIDYEFHSKNGKKLWDSMVIGLKIK